MVHSPGPGRRRSGKIRNYLYLGRARDEPATNMSINRTLKQESEPGQIRGFLNRQPEFDLLQDLVDSPKSQVLNIHGVPGVGKSSLLMEFERRCRESGLHCARISGDDGLLLLAILDGDRIYDAFRILESLSLQLDTDQASHLIFRSFWSLHASITQELATIRRALAAQPRAVSWMSISRDFIAFGESNTLAPMLTNEPGAVVGAAIGAAASEIYARIASASRAWIDNEAAARQIALGVDGVQRLTAAFVEAVNQLADRCTASVIILVDAFGNMATAESWLRDSIVPNLGPRIGLVLATQEPLSLSWQRHEIVVHRHELGPLPEDDARAYLGDHGFTDPHEIESLLELTGRLPFALVLAGATSEPMIRIQSGPDRASINQRVVAGVLSQFADPNMRAVIDACSMAPAFDIEVISAMLGRDVTVQIRALKQSPLMQTPTGERLALDENAREAIFRMVVRERPITAYIWNQRAIEYYENAFSDLGTQIKPHYVSSYLHHVFFRDEKARDVLLGSKSHSGVVEIRSARSEELEQYPRDRVELLQL